MHIENRTLEILEAEFREFCLDHNLDDELIANARIAPGLRRWLRDFDARLEAARVLAPLAVNALATEYETAEHDHAHNAFADALMPYLTNEQRRELDTMRGTPTEIIAEAFQLLGITAPKRTPISFEEFQASARYVEDLSGEFPGEYEPRTPGRVYTGELVIEDSLGAAAGAWMLCIGNSSRCSDNLVELERDLFDFGCAEEYFETGGDISHREKLPPVSNS